MFYINFCVLFLFQCLIHIHHLILILILKPHFYVLFLCQCHILISVSYSYSYVNISLFKCLTHNLMVSQYHILLSISLMYHQVFVMNKIMGGKQEAYFMLKCSELKYIDNVQDNAFTSPNFKRGYLHAFLLSAIRAWNEKSKDSYHLFGLIILIMELLAYQKVQLS